MSNVYDFPTESLSDSPFAEIIEAMKRKSKNEADQYQMFVENLVNDVAYPYKDSMSEFETRSKEMFGKIKASINHLFSDMQKFTKLTWKYEETSQDLVNAVYQYTDFKRQAHEASSVFYKNRLFNALGTNLFINEDKATELNDLSTEINNCINGYLETLSDFKQEFHDLEALK